MKHGRVVRWRPLSILGESAAPISTPDVPPEVGADITRVNYDLSETQCVGLPNYLDLLLVEHTRSLEVHAEYRVRAFSEPRNGRMADVIGSADLSHGLASFPSRQRFEDLVTSELGLPAEAYPSGLSPLPAFLSPGLDQLPLELGKATEDRQHQPAVSRGSIRPGVRERSETRPSFADRVEDVEEIAS